MSSSHSVTVTITNRLGLHARPAMVFVELASTHKSDVTVAKDDQEVDGKSIMQMMMLAATQGTTLTITCKGPDAESCANALSELVEQGFDEE